MNVATWPWRDPGLEQHDVVAAVHGVAGLQIARCDGGGDVVDERRELGRHAPRRRERPRPRDEARAVGAIRVPRRVVGAGADRRARGIVVGRVVRALAVRELGGDPLFGPRDDVTAPERGALAGRDVTITRRATDDESTERESSKGAKNHGSLHALRLGIGAILTT